MCDINITQYGDSCDPGTEDERGEGGDTEQGRGADTASSQQSALHDNTELNIFLLAKCWSPRPGQDAAVQDLLSLELVSVLATELSPALPTSQQQASAVQCSAVQ